VVVLNGSHTAWFSQDSAKSYMASRAARKAPCTRGTLPTLPVTTSADGEFLAGAVLLASSLPLACCVCQGEPATSHLSASNLISIHTLHAMTLRQLQRQLVPLPPMTATAQSTPIVHHTLCQVRTGHTDLAAPLNVTTRHARQRTCPTE
jgi:hypothetical protein